MIYRLFGSIGIPVLLIIYSQDPQNNSLAIHMSIIN